MTLQKNKEKRSRGCRRTSASGGDGGGTGGSGDGERLGRMSPDPPPACKRPRFANRVRHAPNRATMTMRELIYYNPSANPMRFVSYNTLLFFYFFSSPSFLFFLLSIYFMG